MLISLALLSAAAFEIVSLSPGVYAALVEPTPPMYVFANALIILDEEGVTVVDTHQSPAAAEALIDKIRKLTDKPVRFVINTHWHGDHVYGNQVYREQFPDVVFVGHRTIREDMLTLGASMLTEEIASLPAGNRRRASWLSSGIGADGEPLSAEARAMIDYSYRVRTAYLDQLESLELLVPQLTFERELVLHRPGRTIRLLHFGPAHTRGDVVVHLPDSGIVAVGDLVENAFPYFGNAYPAGWARALEALSRLDASFLVPSHGPVQRDRELLEVETRMMRRLADEVDRAVSSGMTLDETQAAVTLYEFQNVVPNAGEGLRTAVDRAYHEARGEILP